jgi:hypothetical protein
MTDSRAKLIIRGAALVGAIAALWALAVLAGAIGRAVINREGSPRALKDLLAYCLVAVLPVIFLRAAVQAWRLQPKGIESIAAGFLLFGLGGAIFSLAQIVFYAGWQSSFVIEVAIASLLLVVVGVGVGVQRRRFSE